MANQYVNKVIVNNETKIDLTNDTVAPENLKAGITAHNASGAPIVGTDDTALKALAAIAPIEGDISSANYTVGAYLIHNNQLYKVTVAIATNETITEGSNVTPITLSDDVKYLIDHPYILPTMSESTKGGAKVGYGLNVENDILSVGGMDDPNDAGPIVKLSAKGWAEQNGTTGKNLYPNTATTQTINGVTLTVNADKSITCTGTATDSVVYEIATPNTALAILPAGTYILSGITGGSQSTYKLDIRYSFDTSNLTGGDWFAAMDGAKTVTFTDACVINRARIVVYSGTTIDTTIYPQLELGSQATEYEPYTGGAPSPSPDYPQEIRIARGHTISGKTGRYVDILVTHDGTTTTIPIPLPERGWVASLSDGTSDILTLDGAGGYEWEINTNENVYDGSSDENWTLSSSGKRPFIRDSSYRLVPNDTTIAVGYCSHFTPSSTAATIAGNAGFSFGNAAPNVAFQDGSKSMTLSSWKTWLQSNPITILYPLGTPQTESGYVDYDNAIPVHATISSADLEGIEVRCVADSGAAEISAAWGKRIENELDSLREIVNTLLANS